MLKYVKQRADHDCGIAAIAMACFADYDAVAAELLPDVEHGNGINDLHMKDWLWRNGWAWQEVSQNHPKGGKYVRRHPWPPSPFASTHIVLLEATRDYHFVVLDFDGRVYDPWKQERDNLSHPDYKSISWVLGLWKIGRRAETVGQSVK